ncbi:MAG: ATP-binding protein [Propionibacteriaceae bacterium]|jgi:predicted ATPase|nr:ATP-binding protein [Propionibacteriaceae bacterium]
MLIRFEVENFRSIRGRQALDLTRAGAGMQSRVAIKEEDVAAFPAVTVAAIYGANAAGKTTMLEAMDYVQRIVRSSARREAGVPLQMEPFLLDEESVSRSFACRVVFRLDEFEYDYGFELRQGRVMEEHLNRSPLVGRRSVSRLFWRDGSLIKTGPTLTGAKASIIRRTRDNSLFLSTAAQDNNSQLLGVYEWFLSFADATMGSLSEASRVLETDAELRGHVAEILQVADLGVCELAIVLPEGDPPEDWVRELADDESQEALDRARRRLIEANKRPLLRHRGMGDRSYPLRWSQESRGTQLFFPLLVGALRALEKGQIVLIDELSGLHPLLVREIIMLFQSRRTNSHGAQLVFTTHDSGLLGSHAGRGYLLDRDQIWLAEKDQEGVTELYPLSDFHPRNTEDIEKAYLQGRFGGLPVLDEIEEVIG